MPMYRFLCQLCYTIVHYGEKHPCFFYKDYDTVYTIPQIDELEEMDTKHEETKEEHTGNSNDNYGNICPAPQQNGSESSYETNTLLTENNEQISPMTASRRRRNYCSSFADTPNNNPYDISHDASLFDSILSVREREINSVENASFQALSESFESDTINESGFRRTDKTQFGTSGYIHELNKCRLNVSSLCHEESNEKRETLSDESNFSSFTHEKECFSESQEDITLKLLWDSKNTSEASTSFANSAFSIGNKELDKEMFEVSEDLTDRPISPERALIFPRRNGDEDATIKQHLVFMKDANTMAGPSTIRPDSIRPVAKRKHACVSYPKQFKQNCDLVRNHRTHAGNNKFVCDICGKGFNHKGHFDRHYRTHTGEKPYACNICGKRFSDPSSLNKHVPTHEGGKRFKCGVCGKTFSRNDSLNRHYKEKHQ